VRQTLLIFVGSVAVVIAASFALHPVVTPGEEGEEPCVGPDCGSEAALAEQRLADRYAPIVYLADEVTDCNIKNGDFRPVPVEVVFGNPSVALRHARGQEEPKMAPTAADLHERGSEYYLDLPGNPRRPGCSFIRDGERFAQGAPNVAYARIVTEDGYDELVLQYWLYYFFNQANNKHESDWEMFQLVFEASSTEEALTGEPDRVGYSQHSGGELALWDDDKLEREGDRPVLRVAAGSHSNRYTPHVFIGRAEQGAGFGCDHATGETILPVEARLMPSEISGPDDPYAWLTFQGNWGELAGPQFDGPTGPNMKRQWNEPMSWEEDLRTSSVRVPAHETFGPDAVQSFCDVVAWGSNFLLPIYLQLGEISLAIVGLIGVGMVLSLTRTRYIPAEHEPLRVRRRLGQIVLSSFRIYAANPQLFVGIGLVFLPATVVVSILHWLVFEVSPIEPIVPLPRGDFAQELVLAFALSELHFGIAYAVVLTACLAALAAIDGGRPTSVMRAYSDVWHFLPRLLPPRLFAIVVVFGLAFTIIGIPFAIRKAVHWSFIEQAVLLDGEQGRGALEASREAAGEDWWWTAGSVASLVLIGLFTAPFVGMLLLLLARSIPLANVNLIATVVHLALVPFISIALALIYFDLCARRGSQG
jgi:hypothetical protein